MTVLTRLLTYKRNRQETSGSALIWEAALDQTYLSRRRLVAGASLAAGALIPAPSASAAGLKLKTSMQSPAQINILSTGADPTGYGDSAPAISSAAAQLPASGGALLFPAGIYRVDSPIALPSKNISIVGDGSNATIILVLHSGIVFAFAPVNPGPIFSMRGIGFCPVGSQGARPASALLVDMPAGPVFNNPSVTLRDIDFSSDILPSGGFYNAMTLSNIWRGLIQNVSHNGPGGTVVGSTFLVLNGFSIDNKFENCIVNQVDVAFLIGSYNEGLHLISPIVAGSNQAVVVGPRVARQASNNALSIYISGGELATYGTPVQFTQQWGGWISGTHIGVSGTDPAMLLAGAVLVQISNCNISGSGNNVGVRFDVTSTAGCAGNTVDNCTFSNIGTPISFGPGVANNTALGLRAIGQSNFPLLQTTGIVQDLSGNPTNNVEWLTGASGPNRLNYLF